MKSSAFLAIFLFAACGDDLKGQTVDAAVNGPSLKISGTAGQQMAAGAPAPAAMVLVQAFANDDETTALGEATTGADGKYSLTVPGTEFDGYLKATKDGNVDTYLSLPRLTADFASAGINEIDVNLFAFLRGPTIGMQATGQGTVALEVVDATLAPVAGAAVTSDPAATHVGYSSTGALPIDITATESLADGRAFLFGVTGAAVTITATATGHTFKPTTLKVRADVFTTTFVTP